MFTGHNRLVFVLVSICMIMTGCSSKEVEDSALIYPSEIENRTLELSYLEPVNGKTETQEIAIVKADLSEVVEIYHGVLVDNNIDYGLYSDDANIAEDLKIRDVYIREQTIILDYEDSFMEFDQPNTHLGYYLIGLKAIVRQFGDFEYLTITVEDKEVELISPEGLVIKNIVMD